MLKPGNRALARPAHVSAVRAMSGFAVAGATGLGLGIWGLTNPEVPFLSLKWVNCALATTGATGMGLSTKYWLHYAQRKLEFSWLAKKQTFTAIGGDFPIVTNRGERISKWPWKEKTLVSPLLAPVGPMVGSLGKSLWRRCTFAPARHPELDAARSTDSWKVEWVPYVTRRREAVDPTTGKEKVQWIKEPIRDDRTQAFARRADWLRGSFPSRYQVVMAWWQTTFKQQMEPLSDAAPFYVEYLQGANLACEPSWWSRKLGPQIDMVPFTQLQELLRELPAPEAINVTPPPALPTRPVLADLWWGKGFVIERSHVERMYYLRLHDKKEAGLSEDEPGDSRPYATGIRDERLIFRPVVDNKQHILVLGGTGVGKTTVFQLLVRQVIRMGAPLIVIDPKGDLELASQTAAGAREEGRAHQFRWFNLVLPRNRNCSTMNNFSTYEFASHLGSRTAAIITQTSDPFFREKAIEMARVFHETCDAATRTLRFYGRNPVTGELADRYSLEVPRVLLAMQYAATNNLTDIPRIDAEVGRILKTIEENRKQRKTDYQWSPEDKPTATLAHMAEFSPKHWNPSLAHCSNAIEMIEHFTAAAMKVASFHVGLDMPSALMAPPPAAPRGAQPGMGFQPPRPAAPVATNPFADPQFIHEASPEIISGKVPFGSKNAPPVSLFQLYREAGTHPLETRLERFLPMNGAMLKWKAFYDHYVPARQGHTEDDAGEIELSLKVLRERLLTLQSYAAQSKESFLEHAATFKAALQRFSGPMRRIVSATDPDAAISKVHEENLILFVSLGSMIDKDGAAGYAKLVFSECLALCGSIYHYHQQKKGQKAKPWYILSDETGRIINDDYIEAAAQVRGAACSMICAAQSRADFHAGLGSKEKAEQFFNNCNTLAQLRAPGAHEAKEVAEAYDKVTIRVPDDSVNLQPSMGGGNDFISFFAANMNINTKSEAVEKVSPEFARSLPMGQLVLDSLGGATYLVQIPVLPPTEVNLKEEYGTLDDDRDAAELRRVGDSIRSEIQNLVATRGTSSNDSSPGGGSPASAPIAPMPSAPMPVATIAAPPAAAAAAVLPPPPPAPSLIAAPVAAPIATSPGGALPLPGSLPTPGSLPRPGAIPSAAQAQAPVAPSAAPSPAAPAVPPAAPLSAPLGQPPARPPLPPPLRPKSVSLPLPPRPGVAKPSPPPAPSSPTAPPVAPPPGDAAAPAAASSAQQPPAAPPAPLRNDGSTVAFPGAHSSSLRLPPPDKNTDKDDLGSGSLFGNDD